MKLESHLPKQSPWIFVAPLLTAVLLLLMYFLLGSGLASQSGVRVRLPESRARLTAFEDAQVVTVAPGSPVRLFWNQVPVSREELAEKLAETDELKRKALIYADWDVSFGQLSEVVQLALAYHFEVAYAAKPGGGGRAP
jgi:biopolymer transport protein ExbD